MQDWFLVELARERRAEILAEVEGNRPVRRAAEKAPQASLRARTARRLFGFAVAVEREETWRAVWERLEAPKHP